jgi:hypothetical protein
VGEISTLTVEIMSTQDEPDIVFTIDSLESQGNKIHIVSGNTQWQGSLVANQPQSFQFSICVIEEGTWPIEIGARRVAEGDKYFAFEIIRLDSTASSGELVREFDYTFSQDEATRRPTLQPIEVSPECSGFIPATPTLDNTVVALQTTPQQEAQATISPTITTTPRPNQIVGWFTVIWGDPGPDESQIPLFDYGVVDASGEYTTIIFSNKDPEFLDNALRLERKNVILTGMWLTTEDDRWQVFQADSIAEY